MSDQQIESTEQSPKAELRLLRGGEPTGDVFNIGPVAIVGRFDPAVGPVDIDLGPMPEGVYVSRKHAEIRFEDGKWIVRDLGSSNGTFILKQGEDFSRIDGEAELPSGGQVAFGNARFEFCALAESDADEPSETPDTSDGANMVSEGAPVPEPEEES